MKATVLREIIQRYIEEYGEDLDVYLYDPDTEEWRTFVISLAIPDGPQERIDSNLVAAWTHLAIVSGYGPEYDIER